MGDVIWQHFRDLRRKGFPTDSRHSNGHQLCPSLRRHISALIRSGIHTVFALGWKETASQFEFTYRYIDNVLSISNPDLQNYLGQMYPDELEIKDTTESNTSASNLDLVLSIWRDGQLRTSFYDKRRFQLPYHYLSFPKKRYSIFASLWCDYVTAHTVCQGLLLLWMFYFLEQCDFHVSFSGKDTWMSGNVWNRPSGRFGDRSKKYEVWTLSQMLHEFWDMIIYSDNLHWSNISLNRDLVTELDLITVLTLLPYSRRFP